MARILLVDDESNMRRSMAYVLRQEDHRILEAASADDALKVITAEDVDVVITDVRLGDDRDGGTVLRAVKQRQPDIEVVLVTAYGTIDDAVGAIKAGAYDYLTKPVDPERLVITVGRAAERRALAREVRQLRAQIGEQAMIAESHAMQAVLRTVQQLARTDSPVLITGESGTGKELVARALHVQSERRNARFVPVNCGALPETILESELFGHRKGAFTGAVSDRKGLLEEAHGGVLFLDELGEMPPAMQVRLLRFLQDGELRRIGETEVRRIDVRLVAATHRSLEEEVASGRIREDFYYRVNVVGVRIPPLRERPEDVPALAVSFLKRYAPRLRSRAIGFSEGAIQLMTRYKWPGNVRELQNAVERALNVAAGELITEADLPAAVTLGSQADCGVTGGGSERERLLQALERHHWNQSRAAESLGISRSTLWRKLREQRIAP